MKKRPTTLEEGGKLLKNDPFQAVRFHANDVDVKVHLVKARNANSASVISWLRAAVGRIGRRGPLRDSQG
jgi:hypothetical protein